ncbi:hypothetical protein [Cyanobium sp. A1C-AMD]|uniref:hypothetical protein n=1 Tax=Cyanobium sp. A1C-AMD TaxID=2823694 RepID=UPI0020CDCA33|nr:hypothetical protein [Cyanobium sp. A1C-AMD]
MLVLQVLQVLMEQAENQVLLARLEKMVLQVKWAQQGSRVLLDQRARLVKVALQVWPA